MTDFGLYPQDSGYFNGYDSEVRGSIFNEFSTAAFRYGHSQIPNFMTFTNRFYRQAVQADLSFYIVNNTALYEREVSGTSPLDAIIFGQISQAAEESDAGFSEQIKDHLFTLTPPDGPGTDLPARNIQRGRDHGIPSYTAVREACGLPSATGTNFRDFVDIPTATRRLIRDAYDTVEDVDLYVGGISETNVDGGNIGPTFACLFAQQFRNLKVGDRFFYENSGPQEFNPAQLDEIRKFTLSRVMCDNMDSIDTIQKYVLLQPASVATTKLMGKSYDQIVRTLRQFNGDSNERRPCSELPSIDYTVF